MLVAFVFLFLVPGYAFLVLFGVGKRWNWIEMVCAAGGVSITVVPLVLYGVTFAGARLSPGSVLGLLLVLGGVCLWDGLQRLRHQDDRALQPRDRWALLLGVTLLLTLGARFWSVRQVDYPLWTDSYHHTMIAHLIADTGRVPSSYAPYAPIQQFSYHFGFHALVAWFHWLSGCSVPRAVVLVGQFVNALAVPTTYLLAVRLLKDRTVGLVSALVVGLISHMPALFVNWGRYTQLSGQVLLPVLIVMTIEALDSSERSWGLWILTGLGVSGLFMVHNRVFLFYGVLVFLFLVSQLVHARRRRPERVWSILQNGVIVFGVALVVSAPWLWRFWSSFGSTVVQEVAQGYQAQRDRLYFIWRTRDLFASGIRPELMVLAVVGAIVGIYRRQRGVILLVAWVGVMLAAANSYLLGIPPLAPNVVVFIVLYLPAAVFIGYLARELASWVARLLREREAVFLLLQRGAVVMFVLSGVGGAVYTSNLVKPQNGFVRSQDLEAMEWIHDNVSEDALFYVSTHFWTPIVAHGLDAGYWMPLLAGRETILPPEPYVSDGSPTYVDFINRRARELRESETSHDLWSAMARYGVTHVYIGRRNTYLDPEPFLADPAHFRLLYERDGVWVFETV